MKEGGREGEGVLVQARVRRGRGGGGGRLTPSGTCDATLATSDFPPRPVAADAAAVDAALTLQGISAAAPPLRNRCTIWKEAAEVNELQRQKRFWVEH